MSNISKTLIVVYKRYFVYNQQLSSAIECPSISIEKAKVKCSADLRFESECDIECLSGYQRKGSEKVTCTLSKTWNPSTFPVCGEDFG